MKRALEEDVAKWKESKEIEGVSASSIIDLKAIIAGERSNQGSAKVRRITAVDNSAVDVTKLKNKGVAERGIKDETDAEREAAQNTYAHAQEKLKEKSRIYDQYVKGGSLEPGAIESEYLIDFERKQWDEKDEDRDRDHRPELFHEDIQMEERRRMWEDEARKTKEEEDKAHEKRLEDRKLLGEVMLETIKGREKAQKMQDERKRKLEMRKAEVQKKVELQREKKEKELAEQEKKLKAEKEEKERKKLHLKQ